MTTSAEGEGLAETLWLTVGLGLALGLGEADAEADRLEDSVGAGSADGADDGTGCSTDLAGSSLAAVTGEDASDAAGSGKVPVRASNCDGSAVALEADEASSDVDVGDTLADAVGEDGGDTLADAVGDDVGDALTVGIADGDSLTDGEALPLALGDGDSLPDGVAVGLGDADADASGLLATQRAGTSLGISHGSSTTVSVASSAVESPLTASVSSAIADSTSASAANAIGLIAPTSANDTNATNTPRAWARAGAVVRRRVVISGPSKHRFSGLGLAKAKQTVGLPPNKKGSSDLKSETKSPQRAASQPSSST